MTLYQLVKKLFGKTIVGETVKESVKETLDEAEHRLMHAVHNAIKMSLAFLLNIIAGVFILVGVAMYLSAHVPGLGNGISYILSGIVVLFLAYFGKQMQKE